MTHQSHEVKIRRMEKCDLQQVLDLINNEGWEYDMSEIDRIHRVDPRSSVVACSGDLIVGGVTVVTLGGRCIIGHAVVREGWRRKGLGKIMINSVMNDMESQGVDFFEVYSVIDAVSFYEKLGFQIIEELRTYVKRGLTRDDCSPLHFKRIRDLMISDLPQIIALDTKVLGFERGAILEALMKDFPTQCKGLFRGTELVGFIMGRTSEVMDDGGPWIMADPNMEDGALLLRALLSSKKTGARLIFGLSERNNMAQKILSNAGFKSEIDQFRLVKSKRKAAEFSPGMMTISAFEFG
jgi:ribosomal protein S18 acetylase RimI-like enzyme